jgi:DNA polymerase alpha subunit B
LRAGDVDKMPEDMFRSIFVEKLSAVLDLVPGAIALLVPSVRDMISDHAVLPQSELRSELVNDPVRSHITLAYLNPR